MLYGIGGAPEGVISAAVIRALEALKEPCLVHLHTDSRYVIDGITGWIYGWQKNGWKTAAKKPVLNADLWQVLLAATRPRTASRDRKASTSRPPRSRGCRRPLACMNRLIQST